jgi:hypothetical protein
MVPKLGLPRSRLRERADIGRICNQQDGKNFSVEQITTRPRLTNRQPSATSEGITDIVKSAKGQYQMLYALLAGCGPMRAGEALGLEIDKHISKDFRTLHILQKAKRGKIQPFLKTKNGERDVDLCVPLAAMLRDFIGTRPSLLHGTAGNSCKRTRYRTPAPHPQKAAHEKVGLITSRRFRLPISAIPMPRSCFWSDTQTTFRRC